MGRQDGNNKQRERDCSTEGNTMIINWKIENEGLRNKVEQLYRM